MGDSGDRGVRVAVLQVMRVIERIDDKRDGVHRFQGRKDVLPIGKVWLAVYDVTEADFPVLSNQEPDVLQDKFIVDPMIQAGGSDAPMPLFQVVLIRDDGDWATAPDAFAKYRLPGDQFDN